METEKINNKLETFTRMVLKDAAHKAGIVINKAKVEKQNILEDKELSFLKEAYEKIQKALQKIERESNEMYSEKLMEAKKTLFNKRTEITDRVFIEVKKRIERFHESPEYAVRLRNIVQNALRQVGQGQIRILVDKCDLDIAKAIMNDFKDSSIEVSDDPLLGGCIMINTTSGVLVDYSFINRLIQQREAFLKLSGINLDI